MQAIATSQVSVRSLWTLAYPMMMAALSGNIMMFADRAFLANYSLVDMNAAAIAMMAVAIPQYGVVGIASIAEVMVGQHNGAGRFSQVAEPVWQMLWLVFILLFAFAAAAFLTDLWVLPPQYHAAGLPFYHWAMISAPLSGAITALAAFYVGRGKPRLVMVSIIFGNVINVGLDWPLIFGVPGMIPALGAQGAAIATTVGLSLQLLILFVKFLTAEHRRQYGTARCRWRWPVLKECLRVGLPNSIGHMCEITAWAVLLQLLARVGIAYVAVLSIGQAIFGLLSFVTDGLQKGVIAMASNLIGAEQTMRLKQVLISGIKLHVILLCVLAIPMLIYPQPIISLFLNDTTQQLELVVFASYLRWTIAFVWLYFAFDGMVWVIAGMLTAAKDTLFIMLTNATTAWAFAVVPVYFAVVKSHAAPTSVWLLANVYAVTNVTIFACRYWCKHGVKNA